MIGVGTVVNDLVVVAFDSENGNGVWICECLLLDDSPKARAQGQLHRCVQSEASLKAGTACCRACAALKAEEDAWHEDARKQQQALDGGN